MKPINLAPALAIRGYKTEAELRWLAEQARSIGRLGGYSGIVEIGTWRGRSTRALADHLSCGVIYTIDTWAGDPRDPEPGKCVDAPHIGRDDFATHGGTRVLSWFWRDHTAHLLAGRIVPVVAPAQQGCAWLEAQFGRVFDLAFIDGCHTYEAVVEDIAACRRLVRSGGLLAGHDHSPTFPGVIRAVEEIGGPEGLVDTLWWRRV